MLKRINPPPRKLGGAGDGGNGAGAVQRAITVITNAESPYTVDANDYLLECDCTAGAITINLPTAVGNTRELLIQKIDNSANAVTLEGFGGETINGALNNSDLDVQYEAFRLNADSANYLLTGGF